MATHNKFNLFGEMMMENRPTMAQFSPDMVTEGDMTKDEWKKYLSICDDVACAAFDYMATPSNPNGFDNFRNAVHKLYAFVETDTRILAIDGYSVRFIPAVVPFKVVKSDAYKTLEKTVRAFKKGMSWAISVTNADAGNPNAVVFPIDADASNLSKTYYSADVEKEYNAVISVWNSMKKEGTAMTVGAMKVHLEELESALEELGTQKWQCYKDYKHPMQSSTGKKLSHVPTSIRKAIEDTMADVLSARQLMTTEQLEKEHAQIKGGRKSK